MCRPLSFVAGFIALVWLAAVVVTVVMPPWASYYTTASGNPADKPDPNGQEFGRGFFLSYSEPTRTNLTEFESKALQELCKLKQDCYPDTTVKNRCYCHVNFTDLRERAKKSDEGPGRAFSCPKNPGGTLEMVEREIMFNNAGRAMLLLSAICAFFAICLSYAASKFRAAAIILVIVSVLGMLCSLAGMAVGYMGFVKVSFGTMCFPDDMFKELTKYMRLGWSFHLSWVSAVLALFVSICSCLLARQPRGNSYEASMGKPLSAY